MLIRLISGELLEYPDDLGALVLADIIQADDQDFSLEEINLFVNGALVLLYDNALSLAENINHARAHYAKYPLPDAIALQKGHEYISQYNKNMLIEDIGYSNQELINQYCGMSPQYKVQPYTIEHEPHQDVNKTELTASTVPTLKPPTQ